MSTKLGLPLFALRMAISLWGFLLAAGLAQPLWAADSPYQLGRGYALGDSGLSLGGYSSSHVEGLGKNPASFTLSSLSLFVSWDSGSKLRFFSETEAENILQVGGSQVLNGDSVNVHMERLYFDYLVADSLSLRVGKILTPVGQWNLIHVDPLVWTTSRPVATTHLFADYATGLMLQGTVTLGKRYLDYSVYSDYSSALDPTRIISESPVFDNAQGLRLRYHANDALQIGLSYADYALLGNASIRNHLTGLDLAWTYAHFTLNSEIVYRNSTALSNQNNWEGYIQGVNPIVGNIYAIGRYEFFDRLNAQTLGQVGVMGLAYRPQAPLIFKLEYRTGVNNRQLAADGLFASFSVLF
ncbi:hypothetical protein [Methylomonas sp. AM2-LC]|uniref:hypothetical protein n=1 Tax=Methylomonas sp. AM2-LC TaxID=3153301 RepID=UPI003267BAE3